MNIDQPSSKNLKINHLGKALDNEGKIIEADVEGSSIIQSIFLDQKYVYRNSEDEIVEVSNYLYFVEKIIELHEGKASAVAQYDIVLHLDLSKVFLDYKDRFVIFNDQNIPCLLSDKAQEDLFELADSYDDDSITLSSKKYPTPPFLNPNTEIEISEFWSKKYENDDTGWDLNEPSPVLAWALKKFKLPKLRVAVLGSGRGHDAHLFSTQGHFTTGIDFSEKAIEQARTMYPESSNLKWLRGDVFNLPENLLGQFDLVFDHTLFCAIDPEKRKALVNVWKKLLSEQGQVLGVFFTMHKQLGPPFGSTEYEIEDLMLKEFRKDYWLRADSSVPKRLGKELLVLATKR